MRELDLEAFHEASRRLDFLAPLEGLLEEFRRGNIADRDRSGEERTLRLQLGEHDAAWEQHLPGLPECRRRRRSLLWEYRRGRRDAYLRELIARHVPRHAPARPLIVNPATVLGRHARMLARALPDHQVLGTDIDPRGDRLYGRLTFWKHRGFENYRFEQESVYEPNLSRRPAAIAFFGACGSVTDGAIDYAVGVEAPFLIFRSCCHDNIGGNTTVVRRPTPINRFFVLKNWLFERDKTKNPGFYFDDRYGPEAYPRSRAARALLDPETMLRIAANTPDSDICRTLVDLDRCLYLRERGFEVMYREELFFAHRRP